MYHSLHSGPAQSAHSLASSRHPLRAELSLPIPPIAKVQTCLELPEVVVVSSEL